MLSVALCNRRGVPIAGLDHRLPGSSVTVTLNGPRQATVPLSLEDEAAAHVRPLSTVLKAWLGGTLIHAGPTTVPQFRGRDRRVDVHSQCPSFYLQRSFVGQRSDGAGLTGHVAGAPYRLENTDQGLIMWRLVEHALPTTAEQAAGVPTHGIVDGTRPQGPQDDGWFVRTREYEPGKQIWEALVQMSEVISGPDFELEPVDEQDGTLARFNVYGRQGSDKSGVVVFEHNTGRNNAVDVQWDPAGDLAVNRATVTGQVLPDEDPPRYTANQADSQLAYGLLGAWQSDPDVSELPTVREKAQGIVAASATPLNVFTVTPAAEGGVGLARDTDGRIVSLGKGFGTPPRFAPDGDYWIGDDISVVARVTPGLDVTLVGRVIEGRITEADEDGTLLTELVCEPRVATAGID